MGGENKNAAADDSSHKLGYFQFFEMELRDGKNASHSYSPFANVRYYDWGLTSIWGKKEIKICTFQRMKSPI